MNRTYGTILLPGAAEETSFLRFPVDGGYLGEDAPSKITPIESFSLTEATGVARVRETSGGDGPDEYPRTVDSTAITVDSTQVTADRGIAA